jgi:hypothetical protein
MPWSKQGRNEDEVATAAVIYLGGASLVHGIQMPSIAEKISI